MYIHVTNIMIARSVLRIITHLTSDSRFILTLKFHTITVETVAHLILQLGSIANNINY